MKEQSSPQRFASKNADDSVLVSSLLLRRVVQDVESISSADTECPHQHPLALSQTPPPPPRRSPYRRLSRLVTTPSIETPAGCISQPPASPRTQRADTPSSTTNTPRPATSCENLTPAPYPLQSPTAQGRLSNNPICSVTVGYGREFMSASRSPSKLRWISSETKIGEQSSRSPSPHDSLRSHRKSIASYPNREAIHLAAGLVLWELLDEHAGADVLGLDVANECRIRLQALSHEFQPGRHFSDIPRSARGDPPETKEQRLFFEAVEDGYVACQFVNKLKPGMIAYIPADKTSAARDWNVRQFFAAARTLGVPAKYLFEPSDLLEGTPDSLNQFAQTINAVALIAGIKPNRSVFSATHPEGKSLREQTQLRRDVNNDPYATPAMRGSTSIHNLHSEDHEAKRISPTRSPMHIHAAKAYPTRPVSLFTTPKKSDYLGGGSKKDISSADSLSINNVKPVITLHRDDGMSPTHFQLSNYIIGRGALGSVYRAVNLETGEMVAVKRIPLRGMSEDDIRQIMDDVALFRALSHPRIIKYLGACRDSNFLNVVQEFAIRGSLSRTLKTFGKLTERRVSNYVVMILDALNYLHRKDIVHGDLKSSKILATAVGDIKLSFTFGVSREISHPTKHDVVGTPNFLAPEVIERQGASSASDIWSLASTITELLMGRPPYSEVGSSLSVMFRIVEDEMPHIPDECSVGLKDFLRSCFQKDPNKRSDAKHLRDHNWLKDSSVWGEDRHSMDNIPILHRFPDQEKPTVTGVAMILGLSTNATTEEQDSSPSSRDFSDLENRSHSFVATKFDKPVTCDICQNLFKIIHGLQCTRCSSTIHARCELKSLSDCNQSRLSDWLRRTASEAYIPSTPLPRRHSLSSTSGSMSSWESLDLPYMNDTPGLTRKLKRKKDEKCVVQ